MSAAAVTGGVRRGPSIVDITVTPIAVQDPPLLNSSGVHEPFVGTSTNASVK